MPFRVTKLDITITIIVFIVFFWAVFIDSFTIEKNEDGTPMKSIDQPYGSIYPYESNTPHPYYPHNSIGPYVTHMNMQFFIGPIILVYEMFQLIVLPGKRRGRELPWRLYIQIGKEKFRDKLRSGIQEYQTWKKTK